MTVNIPGINPLQGRYCDPIYFYQFDNKRLVDAPTGSWPDASFRAIALLATVSETTNADGKVTAAVLTVYDGVSYGFDLSATAVPEPSSLVLVLIAGLPLVFFASRRRTIPSGIPPVSPA